MRFNFTMYTLVTTARCDNCIFWFSVQMECHHGPPVFDNVQGTGGSLSSWPQTTPDDACGEWFPKDHIDNIPRCDTCMFFDPIELHPLEEGFCVFLAPGVYGGAKQPRVDPKRRCSNWTPKFLLPV